MIRRARERSTGRYVADKARPERWEKRLRLEGLSPHSGQLSSSEAKGNGLVYGWLYWGDEFASDLRGRPLILDCPVAVIRGGNDGVPTGRTWKCRSIHPMISQLAAKPNLIAEIYGRGGSNTWRPS